MSDKFERRRRARRKVLPGFPKDVVFTTPEELDAYLGNVKLVCLECGQKRRALGGHLLMHGMTAEDYKRKHGIPWTRGLTGIETRDVKVAQGRERMASGIVEPGSAVLLAKARAARQRERQPVRDTLTARNLELMNACKPGAATRQMAARSARIAANGPDNRGERHNWAKLSDEELAALKAAIERGGRTQRQIGEEFGVSQAYVSLVKAGKVREA